MMLSRNVGILPNVTDRENARYCFDALIVSLAPNTKPDLKFLAMAFG